MTDIHTKLGAFGKDNFAPLGGGQQGATPKDNVIDFKKVKGEFIVAKGQTVNFAYNKEQNKTLLQFQTGDIINNVSEGNYFNAMITGVDANGEEFTIAQGKSARINNGTLETYTGTDQVINYNDNALFRGFMGLINIPGRVIKYGFQPIVDLSNNPNVSRHAVWAGALFETVAIATAATALVVVGTVGAVESGAVLLAEGGIKGVALTAFNTGRIWAAIDLASYGIQNWGNIDLGEAAKVTGAGFLKGVLLGVGMEAFVGYIAAGLQSARYSSMFGKLGDFVSKAYSGSWVKDLGVGGAFFEQTSQIVTSGILGGLALTGIGAANNIMQNMSLTALANYFKEDALAHFAIGFAVFAGVRAIQNVGRAVSNWLTKGLGVETTPRVLEEKMRERLTYIGSEIKTTAATRGTVGKLSVAGAKDFLQVGAPFFGADLLLNGIFGEGIGWADANGQFHHIGEVLTNPGEFAKGLANSVVQMAKMGLWLGPMMPIFHAKKFYDAGETELLQTQEKMSRLSTMKDGQAVLTKEGKFAKYVQGPSGTAGQLSVYKNAAESALHALNAFAPGVAAFFNLDNEQKIEALASDIAFLGIMFREQATQRMSEGARSYREKSSTIEDIDILEGNVSIDATGTMRLTRDISRGIEMTDVPLEAKIMAAESYIKEQKLSVEDLWTLSNMEFDMSGIKETQRLLPELSTQMNADKFGIIRHGAMTVVAGSQFNITLAAEIQTRAQEKRGHEHNKEQLREIEQKYTSDKRLAKEVLEASLIKSAAAEIAREHGLKSVDSGVLRLALGEISERAQILSEVDILNTSFVTVGTKMKEVMTLEKFSQIKTEVLTRVEHSGLYARAKTIKALGSIRLDTLKAEERANVQKVLDQYDGKSWDSIVDVQDNYIDFAKKEIEIHNGDIVKDNLTGEALENKLEKITQCEKRIEDLDVKMGLEWHVRTMTQVDKDIHSAVESAMIDMVKGTGKLATESQSMAITFNVESALRNAGLIKGKSLPGMIALSCGEGKTLPIYTTQLAFLKFAEKFAETKELPGGKTIADLKLMVVTDIDTNANTVVDSTNEVNVIRNFYESRKIDGNRVYRIESAKDIIKQDGRGGIYVFDAQSLMSVYYEKSSLLNDFSMMTVDEAEAVNQTVRLTQGASAQTFSDLGLEGKRTFEAVREFTGKFSESLIKIYAEEIKQGKMETVDLHKASGEIRFINETTFKTVANPILNNKANAQLIKMIGGPEMAKRLLENYAGKTTDLITKGAEYREGDTSGIRINAEDKIYTGYDMYSTSGKRMENTKYSDPLMALAVTHAARYKKGYTVEIEKAYSEFKSSTQGSVSIFQALHHVNTNSANKDADSIMVGFGGTIEGMKQVLAESGTQVLNLGASERFEAMGKGKSYIFDSLQSGALDRSVENYLEMHLGKNFDNTLSQIAANTSTKAANRAELLIDTRSRMIDSREGRIKQLESQKSTDARSLAEIKTLQDEVKILKNTTIKDHVDANAYMNELVNIYKKFEGSAREAELEKFSNTIHVIGKLVTGSNLNGTNIEGFIRLEGMNEASRFNNVLAATFGVNTSSNMIQQASRWNIKVIVDGKVQWRRAAAEKRHYIDVNELQVTGETLTKMKTKIAEMERLAPEIESSASARLEYDKIHTALENMVWESFEAHNNIIDGRQAAEVRSVLGKSALDNITEVTRRSDVVGTETFNTRKAEVANQIITTLFGAEQQAGILTPQVEQTVRSLVNTMYSSGAQLTMGEMFNGVLSNTSIDTLQNFVDAEISMITSNTGSMGNVSDVVNTNIANIFGEITSFTMGSQIGETSVVGLAERLISTDAQAVREFAQLSPLMRSVVYTTVESNLGLANVAQQAGAARENKINDVAKNFIEPLLQRGMNESTTAVLSHFALQNTVFSEALNRALPEGMSIEVDTTGLQSDLRADVGRMFTNNTGLLASIAQVVIANVTGIETNVLENAISAQIGRVITADSRLGQQIATAVAARIANVDPTTLDGEIGSIFTADTQLNQLAKVIVQTISESIANIDMSTLGTLLSTEVGQLLAGNDGLALVIHRIVSEDVDVIDITKMVDAVSTKVSRIIIEDKQFAQTITESIVTRIITSIDMKALRDSLNTVISTIATTDTGLAQAITEGIDLNILSDVISAEVSRVVTEGTALTQAVTGIVVNRVDMNTLHTAVTHVIAENTQLRNALAQTIATIGGASTVTKRTLLNALIGQMKDGSGTQPLEAAALFASLGVVGTEYQSELATAAPSLVRAFNTIQSMEMPEAYRTQLLQGVEQIFSAKSTVGLANAIRGEINTLNMGDVQQVETLLTIVSSGVVHESSAMNEVINAQLSKAYENQSLTPALFDLFTNNFADFTTLVKTELYKGGIVATAIEETLNPRHENYETVRKALSADPASIVKLVTVINTIVSPVEMTIGRAVDAAVAAVQEFEDANGEFTRADEPVAGRDLYPTMNAAIDAAFEMLTADTRIDKSIVRTAVYAAVDKAKINTLIDSKDIKTAVNAVVASVIKTAQVDTLSIPAAVAAADLLGTIVAHPYAVDALSDLSAFELGRLSHHVDNLAQIGKNRQGEAHLEEAFKTAKAVEAVRPTIIQRINTFTPAEVVKFVQGAAGFKADSYVKAAIAKRISAFTSIELAQLIENAANFEGSAYVQSAVTQNVQGFTDAADVVQFIEGISPRMLSVTGKGVVETALVKKVEILSGINKDNHLRFAQQFAQQMTEVQDTEETFAGNDMFSLGYQFGGLISFSAEKESESAMKDMAKNVVSRIKEKKTLHQDVDASELILLVVSDMLGIDISQPQWVMTRFEQEDYLFNTLLYLQMIEINQIANETARDAGKQQEAKRIAAFDKILQRISALLCAYYRKNGRISNTSWEKIQSIMTTLNNFIKAHDFDAALKHLTDVVMNIDSYISLQDEKPADARTQLEIVKQVIEQQQDLETSIAKDTQRMLDTFGEAPHGILPKVDMVVNKAILNLFSGVGTACADAVGEFNQSASTLRENQTMPMQQLPIIIGLQESISKVIEETDSALKRNKIAIDKIYELNKKVEDKKKNGELFTLMEAETLLTSTILAAGVDEKITERFKTVLEILTKQPDSPAAKRVRETVSELKGAGMVFVITSDAKEEDKLEKLFEACDVEGIERITEEDINVTDKTIKIKGETLNRKTGIAVSFSKKGPSQWNFADNVVVASSLIEMSETTEDCMVTSDLFEALRLVFGGVNTTIENVNIENGVIKSKVAPIATMISEELKDEQADDVSLKAA
ncbi:MAG: hypothetical protein KKH94_01220 [Candidatus Omnitrophica bacterium]|nr:hypothetical protein [Candidatus Omnitrophota bacterium]